MISRKITSFFLNQSLSIHQYHDEIYLIQLILYELNVKSMQLYTAVRKKETEKKVWNKLILLAKLGDICCTFVVQNNIFNII